MNVTLDNGKVKGIRSTETVCNATLMDVTVVRDTVTGVTVMDETVYREDIGFDETVIDVSVSVVTFVIVTVSDVKVSWSVYKILDKCILIRLDVGTSDVSVFMFLSSALLCALACVLLTAGVKRETLHCWRVGY